MNPFMSAPELFYYRGYQFINPFWLLEFIYLVIHFLAYQNSALKLALLILTRVVGWVSSSDDISALCKAGVGVWHSLAG